MEFLRTTAQEIEIEKLRQDPLPSTQSSSYGELLRLSWDSTVNEFHLAAGPGPVTKSPFSYARRSQRGATEWDTTKT
jgi:hypothetical protein